MNSPQTLLAQWREANRIASEAEQALFEASLMYGKGQGPMPTEEEMQRTRDLRTAAGQLLKLAMAEFSGGGASYISTRPSKPSHPDSH